MEAIYEKLIDPLLFLVNGSQRIYWLYLYGALVIAVLIYFRLRNKNEELQIKGLFKYLFPRDIYTHHSAINDYGFFYLNSVLKAIIFIPLFGYLTLVVSNATDNALVLIVPSLFDSFSADNFLIGIGFSFISLLAMDFSIYLGHYWQHKNPWLWEFHKVHHSAEVLTPMTVYRMHPVDDMLTTSLTGISGGIVFGIFYFITGGEAVLFLLFGLNIFLFLFYLLGYNLRHSHIWVDYGPFWSRVFISPAQHQIHHSSEKRHFDRNIGFIFAFWDRIFGTLYVPKEHETFDLGLSNNEHHALNQSLASLYIRPFLKVVQNIRESRNLSWPSMAHFALFFVIVIPSVAINYSYSNELPPVIDRVYLEEMTWTEVRDDISKGKVIVIVPTGGTEQNGPHVVLGKHNKIIHYTAGKIAERLGNALVAPVITYVPEGSINPPGGHMKYPGTISIPESVFESVIENTARSMKQHGFKVICFVGDSGGNQAGQQRVTDILNKEWQNSNVQIINVSDYYNKNGQISTLMNQGFDVETIGGHAGIRDTSELMAIYPQGVRNSMIGDNRESDFNKVGADGDSRVASPDIGKKLIEQKIKAAVRQINRELESKGN